MNIKKSEAFHIGWELCARLNPGNKSVESVLRDNYLPIEIQEIAGRLSGVMRATNVIDAKIQICELLDAEDNEEACTRCGVPVNLTNNWCVTPYWDASKSIEPLCHRCYMELKSMMDYLKGLL